MSRLTCVAALTLALACAEEPKTFDPTVTEAFNAVVGAVRAKDGGRLYDLSPKATRELVDTLFAEQRSALDAVRDAYPEADRAQALESLGGSLVEGAESGRDLFIALLDLNRLTLDAAAERGLEIDAVTVSDTEAVLTTKGGETFRFVKEADGLKVANFGAQLEASAGLRKLRANLAIARKNLAAWDKAISETTDRTKPEGTFNVLVEAVRRGARVMVFEILDKASRDELTAALAVVKSLQAASERQFPDPAARRAALASKKLEWVERIADERSLFVALWDTGYLAQDLPVSTKAEILGVDNSGDDSAVLRVSLDGAPERRFPFVRNEVRRWCFAGLPATLQREGTRRLEAELRAWPAPTAP